MTKWIEPTDDMIKFLDMWNNDKQITYIDFSKLLRLEFPGLNAKQARHVVKTWRERGEAEVNQV